MHNIHRFLFRVVLLHFLTTGIVPVAAACTAEDMTTTLSAASSFSRMMLHKAKYGYLYAMPKDKTKSAKHLREAEGEVKLADAEALTQLASSMKGLNAKHKTTVLLYGNGEKTKCIWLIGESGVIAASQLDFDPTATVVKLREELDVTSTNRKPRSDEECVFGSDEVSARSNEETLAAQQALARVSQVLLPPSIATALLEDQSTERLVVVPGWTLRSIPFSALPLGDSGRSIVDKYAVIISSSVPAITVSRTKEEKKPADGQHRRFLVVGDPDLSKHKDYCWSPLPNALDEAQHVANRVGDVSPLLGSAATFDSVRSRLTKDAQTLKLIFFSTHGVSDAINPADKSFLALKGSHLHGADIRKLKSKLSQKPIVVMSACQTGLGKTFPQGMFGLIEAWENAGASQVVASLWDVDDEGTATLMKRFADVLAARKYDGAEFAMAEAMRSVRSSKPHPSIWAAFNVFGAPTD